MPDFAKGCLFVGAAVAVGILAGLVGPTLVSVDGDRGRSATTASRNRVPPPPVMPFVTGQKVELAEEMLDRRGIEHETVGGVLGMVVPSVFEVCETDPASGEPVRGTAYLHVDLPGLCF